MNDEADQASPGLVEVAEGWAVMRGGKRIDDHVYTEEWAAHWTAGCFPGAYVVKARRVRSLSMKKARWIIKE